MSDIKDFKSEWSPAPIAAVVPSGGTTAVRATLTATHFQLFFNTDTQQQEMWNGTAWIREDVPLPWTIVSTPTTLGVGDYVMLVPTAAFSITLPPTPIIGSSIAIADGSGTIATTNVTVLRNGNTIKGVAQDLILNINDMRIEFIFTGTDWRVL